MSRKAKITLLLDLADKLSGKLGKLESKISAFQDRMQKKLNKVTDKIGNRLGVTGENLKRTLKLATLSGFATLSALTYKSVQAAENFDAAFLPIRQLNLDKSKNELDSYRVKIRDASFEVGTSLRESTDAIYDLQSATGLYGDDAITIFKKIGNYSIATGANIKDSMNSTTKAMKAFGLGVKDIDKLLESNAKTVQTGITTFDELARVQTEYAGAAAAGGQNIDSANKVFAMFTSVAKNSDTGATMAKTFFQGLGQQAEKFEKELGIKVFDEKGNMKQADEILKNISKRFKTMNDEQITKTINKIGGPEGLRAAMEKVKTGAEDMIKTFDAFDNSKFSLSDALKNAKGDFSTMKKIFSNRLEVIFAKIGEKILPMVANIFDKINPMLEWLYKNIDWILPAFSSFIGVLGSATAAVWLFNAAMAANPIGLIIIGISALIGLLVAVIVKFDQWGSAMLMILGPIGVIINAIMILKRNWESIIEAFNSGGIIAAFYRIRLVLLDALMHPLQRILEMISSIPGVGNIASKWAGNLKEFREKMNLISSEEKPKEEEKKEEKKNSIYGNNNNKNNNVLDKFRGNKVGDSINKIKGASTSAKNITINIDAIHKGDNNLNGGAGKTLTLKEYEEMFNEFMMRIIRNAEMS